MKEESLERRSGRKRVPFLKREQDGALLRDREGAWAPYLIPLRYWQTALASIRDPHQFPELEVIRLRFERWRFYHHFSTADGSPLRKPQVAMRSPILSHEGANLAAVLGTLVAMGESSSPLA